MNRFLCGVVIEKEGELEKFCQNEAAFAIPITDVDDLTVTDGICLCSLHSDRFDEGRSLMIKSRKGVMMLIRSDPDAIMDTGEVAPHTSPNHQGVPPENGTPNLQENKS